MSEDRLEKALAAIKNETIDNSQVEKAGVLVMEKLKQPGAVLCSEFQLQFNDYLEEKLSSGRKLLMEDHLGRCTSCRARLAELKGESRAIPFSSRKAVRWPRWGTWAAAAALVFGILYMARDNVDRMLAPGGPRATVVSLTGALYLVPEGSLSVGSSIDEGVVIRSSPGARARLKLSDGSLVDVNENTELSLHASLSEKSIRLQRGDIILKAAKQHWGHLRVQTRDSIASVKGTIFAVSSGISGSVVSVVEGSVAVTQPNAEVILSPGEQSATNSSLARSVQNAIAWSPDAKTYLEILASLVHIDKQLADFPSPMLRTQSSLLESVPANMIVYGAVPNISGTVNQALSLAEQQSAENPAFNQWWNSNAAGGLKQLIGRIQAVTPLLGDEIVYGMCARENLKTPPTPVLLAEVRKGKRAELAAELDSLGSGMNQIYYLTDTLLAASNTKENLQWLIENMGQGAGTPFTNEIAARYRDGAAWLLGIDMESIIAMNGANRSAFINAQQVKHLFIEQKLVQGNEENEIAVTFNGQRTGLASFLANSSSGGAAEYLSNDALVAGYIATREPHQLFDELSSLFAKANPRFKTEMAESEAKLGFSIADDLAAAFGTESAVSIEGLTLSGPVWMAAIQVHNPSTIQRIVRTLVDMNNAEFAGKGLGQQIILSEDTVDGRKWTTIKFSREMKEITLTFDNGYLVVGSDRGAVLRALATRNGGSPLIWSQEFQQQLPASTGLHPAGFIWLNTKGALKSFESLAPNPTIGKLFSQQDPILVIFDGTTEQIRAVSRTHLSSMLMNMLLMQGIQPKR